MTNDTLATEPMKILVVEDHPLVREALREHLRQLQPRVEIHEARNNAEANAIAEENSDLDLVLLDLMLPDAHGFKALIALRERYPALPVVVFSAESDRKTVLGKIGKASHTRRRACRRGTGQRNSCRRYAGKKIRRTSAGSRPATTARR